LAPGSSQGITSLLPGAPTSAVGVNRPKGASPWPTGSKSAIREAPARRGALGGRRPPGTRRTLIAAPKPSSQSLPSFLFLTRPKDLSRERVHRPTTGGGGQRRSRRAELARARRFCQSDSFVPILRRTTRPAMPELVSSRMSAIRRRLVVRVPQPASPAPPFGAASAITRLLAHRHHAAGPCPGPGGNSDGGSRARAASLLVLRRDLLYAANPRRHRDPGGKCPRIRIPLRSVVLALPAPRRRAAHESPPAVHEGTSPFGVTDTGRVPPIERRSTRFVPRRKTQPRRPPHGLSALAPPLPSPCATDRPPVLRATGAGSDATLPSAILRDVPINGRLHSGPSAVRPVAADQRTATSHVLHAQRSASRTSPGREKPSFLAVISCAWRSSPPRLGVESGCYRLFFVAERKPDETNGGADPL